MLMSATSVPQAVTSSLSVRACFGAFSSVLKTPSLTATFARTSSVGWKKLANRDACIYRMM